MIASVCAWHEHHALTHAEFQRRARAQEELVLAAHSLAEIFAVLTRLPPPRRLRGEDALIATAALKAEAAAILTWNQRNFAPFADDIRVESPP